MAETTYTPLTEENAAFVEVQKIALADVVATKFRALIPAGSVIAEDISIYIVVQPKGPEIMTSAADFVTFGNQLEKFDALMRERAGILEYDQVWCADEINAESIASIFKRIESTNSIALQGGFVDYDKNGQITVITEKLV